MSDDNLQWLMRWYLAECNGDWEHSYGVTIESTDNPGWTLKIDLPGTRLHGRPFAKVERGEIAHDLYQWRRHGSWCVAQVIGDTFEAACGPLDLPAAIQMFRDWVEEPDTKAMPESRP